jgi:hypothetical protein
MIKFESLCVQGLTGKYFKTVFYKLLVFRESGPFKDLISTVLIIIEQRMPYITEMDPYLMGPACFQTAFHNRHISEILNYPVMSYCRFPHTSVREHLHNFPVAYISANIAGNGTFRRIGYSPDNSNIFPASSPVIELFRQSVE